MSDQTQVQDFKGNVTKLSPQLQVFVAAIRMLERVAPSLAARFMAEKFVTPRRKKNVNYTGALPAGGRRIVVFHNMSKLTGWAWGDDGPAILLVHGWEGHTGRMIPLVEPLLNAGYRVFALDAPGHGLSPQAKTHLLDVGQAIRAMMEQHGPFHGVIAHSFGAAATAIMLEDEPGLMPEKLVLLSPMRDLQQHFDIFARIGRLSPTMRERVHELAAGRVGRHFEQVSTVEAVRKLKRPGLVIHDRDDTLIPYDTGLSVASNWHGAQFITTEKLGHRLALKDADIWQQIIEFLAPEHVNITSLRFYKRASGY
jgi:pimeloyl-ACP methyl ester carboxylesterase